MKIARLGCAGLALLAACGSPQPSAADATRPPVRPSTDAAPPPAPFAQSSACLPEDPADMPIEASPPPPKVVDGPMLEALRLTGRARIEPAPQHRRPLWRRHRRAVAVVAKYCIDVEGRVASVRLLKESGYPPFDEQVTREVSCWTFRPLIVDGSPTPACTIFTFLYRTSPPSLAPAP